MAKKRKRFHARVEIYFVIYLATILSFFAVEGEMRSYKKKQNDIILAIAKDKIEQLVEIDRIDVLHLDDTLQINLKLNGFFESKSLKGEMRFLPIAQDGVVAKTTIKNYSYELIPQNNNNENEWFFVKVMKNDFGDSDALNQPYLASVDLSVEPKFNEKLFLKWEAAYKDRKVVEKLIKAIDKVGSIKLTQNFPNKIVPMGIGTVTPFTIQIPQNEYSVLLGLDWEVPVYIGGVSSTEDFDFKIVKGNQLVLKKAINTPETKLFGLGKKSGNIKIVATRISDNEKAAVNFKLNVRPPTWVVKPTITERYIGDPFTFDGSLRDISSSQIKVEYTVENTNETKSVLGPIVSIPSLAEATNIHFKVFVNNQQIDGITHTLKVLTPPPPKIKLVNREPIGSNMLIFEFTTYGLSNEVIKFQQLGGISRNKQMGDVRIVGSKKIYEWQVEMEEPFDSKEQQEIRFKVWDKMKQNMIHQKNYIFNY